MKATREQMKQKAIENMKKLDIYKPYIRGFEQEDQVCFFEGFGGFWVNQEPEIEEKMKWVEENFDCVVYAITHEITSIGEMWDFIFVSSEMYEWDDEFQQAGNRSYVYAYVWNKDDDYCSEPGTIGLRSFGGGIRRVE